MSGDKSGPGPGEVSVDGEINAGWTSYYGDGETVDIVDDEGSGEATTVGEPQLDISDVGKQPPETALIKPGRGVYHYIVDGDVLCGQAKASNGEERPAAKVPVSQVEGGWSECKQCRKKLKSQMTRDELANELRRIAFGTTRESSSLNKDELLGLLSIVKNRRES